MEPCGPERRAVLVALLSCAWLASGGIAEADRAAQATTPAPQGYAGEKACLACHDTQARGYHGGAHGRQWSARTPMATRGCESCHGPGQAHVDGGGDKTRIRAFGALTPHEQSAACTACHDRGVHAFWSGSQHDHRDVGCTTCHSIHDPGGAKQLRTVDEPALCGRCHRDKVTRQLRFSHMPLREGSMTCSSCHNVHGSANARLLKAGTTVGESCTGCHSEKRGPFLWEHPPVVENCTTCHDAHGSNTERMLTARQPFLCQRCHVTSRHPPTVYDGYLLKNSTNANKVYGRSCVVCHQGLHGSNAPSGRAFLR